MCDARLRFRAPGSSNRAKTQAGILRVSRSRSDGNRRRPCHNKVHSVPPAVLKHLIKSGERPASLASPYREHLA
jgi:hypothetical protein